MPLLLVNEKEVRHEVHTMVKLAQSFALLCFRLSGVTSMRKYFSQPRIVDLLEHLWKCSRQISSQAKHLGAGQMKRHQMIGDDLSNQPVYLSD